MNFSIRFVGRLVCLESAAAIVMICCSGIAMGQGITQPNKAAVVASEAYDNRRIQDGMEKDKAAARNKEERMAVVNEAFKRLQLLHNELMMLMSSTEAVENVTIATAVQEVRLRASQLDANLALPELPKNKSEKKEPENKEPAKADVPLKDQMAAVCTEIRAFVKNVNLSPADLKAGIQARRDLVAIMEKSDQILLKLAIPAKA